MSDENFSNYEGFEPSREDEQYYSEMMASLDEAREVMPEQEYQRIDSSTQELHQSMRDFKAAEKEIGSLPEVWQEYHPQHEEIKTSIKEMTDAYRENQPEEIRQESTERTVNSLEEATHYFQQEREQYLAREAKLEAELEEIREQMGELQKSVQSYSPEKLAECIAVSTQFLQQVDTMRKMVRKGQGEQQRGMHKAIANSVSKVYMSVKEAPARAKKAVKLQVYKAADKVVHRVAGAFDRAIDYMERKKQEFLNLSPLELERQMKAIQAEEQKRLEKELGPELAEARAKQAAMTPKEKLQTRQQEAKQQGLKLEKAIAV